MLDIYLDFEATQFKENVIAIGATCSYGQFDCLVKPPKKDKLTPFITQLTGITKEMLQDAPSAEEAFSHLYLWIVRMGEEATAPTFFHVYGDMDKNFLKTTAENIENLFVKTFVLNLAESLIDDSVIVKKFFHAKAIGIHKAMSYFNPNLPAQNHDPLDDAILLENLINSIRNSTPLEDCPFTECIPQKKKANDNAVEKVKQSYIIRVNHTTEANAKERVFHNYKEACEWMLQKVIAKNPEAQRQNILKRVKKAIDTSSIYMNYRFKKEIVKENDNNE